MEQIERIDTRRLEDGISPPPLGNLMISVDV